MPSDAAHPKAFCYLVKETGRTSIHEPAPDVPELDRTGIDGAHDVRQHKADREQRQQQNGEQTEEHIHPAEPQTGERGGAAL